MAVPPAATAWKSVNLFGYGPALLPMVPLSNLIAMSRRFLPGIGDGGFANVRTLNQAPGPREKVYVLH